MHLSLGLRYFYWLTLEIDSSGVFLGEQVRAYRGKELHRFEFRQEERELFLSGVA